MTYFKYPERRSDTRERDTRSQYLCAKVSDFLSRGEVSLAERILVAHQYPTVHVLNFD